MDLCKLNDVLPLVKDSYSCLQHTRKTILIPLPPSHMNKVRLGIKQALNADIAKKLNGFLLGFGKIRILSHSGSTYQDESTIWVPVQLDFVLFIPENGKQVRAKVQKLGIRHIACLIHNRFNAQFRRDTIPSEYENFSFKVGQHVLLEINDFEVIDKILDIKSTLIEIDPV